MEQINNTVATRATIAQTIAATMPKFYGERMSAEQLAAAMFGDESTREECRKSLISAGFPKGVAVCLSAEICREISKKAAIFYVAIMLGGRAHDIAILNYPGAILFCESAASGVEDPRRRDLPEYARILRDSGAIHWGEHAEILTAEQRAGIEAYARNYTR